METGCLRLKKHEKPFRACQMIDNPLKIVTYNMVFFKRFYKYKFEQHIQGKQIIIEFRLKI